MTNFHVDYKLDFNVVFFLSGKGLGKRENGISEAIKVKVKCDKSGVGHHEGEQFTFHWWDHVFNKASSNLAVEASEMSAKLARLEEQEREFLAKYRAKTQEPSKPTNTETARAHRERHGKQEKNSCRERDVPTPDSGGEPEDGNAEELETRETGLLKKKKKKKKRTKTLEEEFQGGAEELGPGEEGMKKKKLKRERQEEALQEETTPQDSEKKPKKKRSKALEHE
ncbi:UNVERIFIED_CONTAM: hypothetical protein FKN15_000284 [Acipenser sinensis]